MSNLPENLQLISQPVYKILANNIHTDTKTYFFYFGYS